ncbi:MAG: hypothetical protein GY906_05440 [bacterium]|nr:hypothetical protein [bacterium]
MRLYSIVLAGVALAAAAAAEAQIRITGSVKTPMAVSQSDLAAMRQAKDKIRLGTPEGQYRATFEVSGPSLWSVLEKVQIEKKVADGFDRPIDLLVVVKGRQGHEALFSIGELQMGNLSGRVLLADRIRHIIPHHHEEVPPLAEQDGWLNAGVRKALSVPEDCVGCHAEEKVPAVDIPRGVCLIAAGDSWPPRFVEDVVEISIRQVGITVPVHMKKGTAAQPSIRFVRLDGSSVALHSSAMLSLGAESFSDATFGMGRGFHGIHSWTGLPLSSLVAAQIPAGTDLDRLWILVTAADGYRIVLSGKEVFTSPNGVILATTEDDQPLGERGPMRLVVPADFYIDRSVHSVQEIRLGEVTKGDRIEAQ